MTGNAAPPLTLESSADGIYTLTLDAPKRVNAVDIPMVQALNAALARVHAAPQARVLVLRSSSRSFCAGGDISAIRDSLSDPERLLGPLIEQFHDAILAFRRLPVPVIGSVRGAAAGGGYSLAMACDLIVASDNARFVAGYPALGTSSDGGLSHFLMRRLGSMRAMDALLLRSTLSAADAQSLGLVARVVADAQLDEQTQQAAAQMAAQAPQAVREFKALLNGSEDAALAAQLKLEKQAFLRCAKTEDFRQRVEAFLARRP